MVAEYTIQFDRMMMNYHIQEIEVRVREIKESYRKCEQLSNTINDTSCVPIPANFEPFIQKYFEIPIENRETYIRCFNSEEQDKIRKYLEVKESGLIIASFVNEVDKATKSINSLIQQGRELQKILPSIEKRKTSIQKRTYKNRLRDGASIENREKLAYIRISSFTFEGQTYPVNNWSDYLVKLCSLMYQMHPDKFAQVTSLTRPRGGALFSRDPKTCIRAMPVSDSGVYVEVNLSATKVHSRSLDVIGFFGYQSEDLSINTTN